MPALEPLNTAREQTTDRVDRPIEQLYFVKRSLISFVKTVRDGRTVEVRAGGIEGVTNPNAHFKIDGLRWFIRSSHRHARETTWHGQQPAAANVVILRSKERYSIASPLLVEMYRQALRARSNRGGGTRYGDRQKI